MKRGDQNDALIAGTLSHDAFEGGEEVRPPKNPSIVAKWAPPMTREQIEEKAKLPVPWLMTGMIAEGQVTVVFAPPKTCKSMFLTGGISLALANGKWPLPGFTITRICKVAYMSWEDNEQRMSYRTERGYKQFGSEKIPDLWPSERCPDVLFPAHEEAVTEWIIENGYDVLILDTQDFSMDVLDSNSMGQTREWRRSIRRMCAKTRCAFVLVAHTAKSSKARDLQERIAGSIGFAGLADNLIGLSRAESGDFLLEAITKDKPPMRWKMDYNAELDDPWSISAEVPETSNYDSVISKLRQLSINGTWCGISELAELLEIKRATVSECLRSAGTLVESQPRKGKKGGGQEYRIVPQKSASAGGTV